MSYHVQSSFAAGELDPALHERTTFDKYKSGLKTLRNAVIGKTGRIISRNGLKFFKELRDPNAPSGVVTSVDPVGNNFFKPNHNMGTGTKVRFTTTGTLPNTSTGPLLINTDYYVIHFDNDYFGIYYTLIDANNNTNGIDITTAGTGILTVIPEVVIDTKAILYSPIYTSYLIEFGHRYIRIHNTSTNTYVDGFHQYTSDDLPYVQLMSNGNYLYVFRVGQNMLKIDFTSLLGEFIPKPFIFFVPTSPGFAYGRIVSTGDYNVDYQFTCIYSGEESQTSSTFEAPQVYTVDPSTDVFTKLNFGYNFTGEVVRFTTTGTLPVPLSINTDYYMINLTNYTFKVAISLADALAGTPINIMTAGVGTQTVDIFGFWLPDSTGEKNEFTFVFNPAFGTPTEIRAYRRPRKGAAYGFIGLAGVTGNTGTFIDYGQNSDFTNSPPSLNFTPVAADLTKGPEYACPRTGIVYQQKLLLTRSENEEAIDASRTGFQNNFYRDYPLSSDGALTFKAGTTGSAKVLRMIDGAGLIVFTTAGIYQSLGALTPDNLSFLKKGNWVINEKVPALDIPGAVLFIDKSTNTVRTLIESNEAQGFAGNEVSIFSNHLFVNRNTVSWSFQDGDVPLIWTVMDDGSLVALTYQREHEMQAWSRHDTDGDFESVAVLKSLDAKSVGYFIIKRGTKRYIEYTTPRFEDNFKDLCLMDSAVTFKSQVNSDAVINVTEVVPNDWEGLLTLTADVASFVNTAGNGAIGTVFRFFDSQGSAVDLVVTAFNSTTSVTVQPSVLFPSAEALDIDLYKTFSILTGLGHLEGKSVSVMSDGYVVASPNNDIENYTTLTVTGGSITLPNSMRGAFVHVGLPYTVDVETLDIDTVEQKPTLLEAQLVHKVYIKIYNNRGVFVGSKFPNDDKVQGLTDIESRIEDIEFGNIGNAAQEPITKRVEVVIPNDWKSNGRVCLRQVDPLPTEILSIIPDMTILY